ncbi:MAG: RhuM family protein [Candidatus Methanoperedens sp.]
MNKGDIVKKQSDFILYTGKDGKVNIDVFLQDETVWLTQNAIGKLFGKSKATISEHLTKIYAEGELEMDSTVRKFRTVQAEGSRQVERDIEYYNLDAIISVGYRVNSYQATQFRIWATRTLKEYIIKGFVLNDERLKQGNQVFGKDYISDFDKEIKRITGKKDDD